jgi:hypothetical protein
MPPELSPETQLRLDTMFSPPLREEASTLISGQCGNNLPFCEKYDAFQLERIRFSVLKLSGGNIDKLKRAITLAQKDWRDILVAAGFANDPLAHKTWNPAP